VGSTIAHILEDQGHSVAVIDRDPEAFRKLPSGFKGSRITGLGFDREILAEAGIDHADRLRRREQRRQLQCHRGPGQPASRSGSSGRGPDL